MISKNHRQNHNFQILYFLIGSCHTHDAAYFLLQDLKEERESAVKQYEISQIRSKAKLIKINELLKSDSEIDVINGQADILEYNNSIEQGKVLYKAACDELNFINTCIEKIKPLCKYKELPDDEACQAMQQEEWKYELIQRAENYILTSGTIPADHFEAMRMHPEFSSEIFPRINEIQAQLQSPEGLLALVTTKQKNLLEYSN